MYNKIKLRMVTCTEFRCTFVCILSGLPGVLLKRRSIMFYAKMAKDLHIK